MSGPWRPGDAVGLGWLLDGSGGLGWCLGLLDVNFRCVFRDTALWHEHAEVAGGTGCHTGAHPVDEAQGGTNG